MADADEDRIPSLDPSHPSHLSTNSKDDGEASESGSDSDAAPDYRFLTTTTASTKHALPARGTKDFEPNPTARQSDTLTASRHAMTDALSVTRVHSSRKNEMVGVYFSDPAQWDGRKYEEEFLAGVEDEIKRGKMRDASVLSEKGEGRCVAVEKFTSTYARTMGRSDRRNWSWLLPEEALFLIERGSLDLRYTVQEGEDDKEMSVKVGEEEPSVLKILGIPDADDGSVQHKSQREVVEVKKEEETGPGQVLLRIGRIPMSLQGAYAAFIGKSGLTLERYIVYANLKRAGYIVQRAPTWHGPLPAEISSEEHTDAPACSTEDLKVMHRPSTLLPSTNLVYRLLNWLLTSPPKAHSMACHNSVVGPLIGPGLFRSYGDIFRQLHLIPRAEDSIPPAPSAASDTSAFTLSHPETHSSTNIPVSSSDSMTNQPLLPTFHLTKPSALAGYKKSSPPPPHYTVVVLDARTTNVPTSTQIGQLLDSMPHDTLENEAKKRLETRIKHGKKNVLIAVVDSGLVSYMRFSSGGFGSGNVLWEENERRGQQRGGKRGGGFRGRGGRGRGSGRGRGRGS